MPCCGRRVHLTIPIEDGRVVHERACRDCDHVWTFVTELRITPAVELNENQPSEFGFSTSLLEGRPREVAASATLRRGDGWIDAQCPPQMLQKALEIKARRWRASAHEPERAQAA
jgi:hypothetical protein